MTSSRDRQREFIRRAEAVGWVVKRQTNGHYRVTSGVTGKSTTMPGTGGRGRGSQNAEAWFKRHGLYQAEERKRRHDERERRRAIERDRERSEATFLAGLKQAIFDDDTVTEDVTVPTESPTTEHTTPQSTTPQPHEETDMERHVRGKTHVDEIIRMLADANGRPVHVDTIAAQLGLGRHQVQKAIVSARTRGNENLEIVVKGRSYRWGGGQTAAREEASDEKVEPQAPAAPARPETAIGDEMVFELVGKTRSRLIIKDEHGKLYEARELD